jgi:PilZ domain
MTEQDFGEVFTPADRRSSDRKRLIIDVQYDGGNGTGIARTRDIAVGGLYMTTASTLDIGTPILMTISLKGRHIQLDGVVMYSDRGHGVGVSFKDVATDDFDLLRRELEMTS